MSMQHVGGIAAPEMGGLDLQAFVDLGVKIDTLADEMRAQRDALERARQEVTDRIPSRIQMPRSAVGNAAGMAILDFLGPQQGRRWEIRSIAVGGAQASSTPTYTTGFVFVAPFNPDSLQTADLSIFNVRDLVTETLPQVAFYSADQLTLEYPERLWVVFTGAQNTVSYGGFVTGLDYPIILGMRSAVTL